MARHDKRPQHTLDTARIEVLCYNEFDESEELLSAVVLRMAKGM